MLIPRHLSCEVADDDAIIINVARALKSDFLTKKPKLRYRLVFTVFDGSFLLRISISNKIFLTNVPICHLLERARNVKEEKTKLISKISIKGQT